MEKIRNQTIVLRELYDTGKKMNVKQIASNTNLTISQVHNALSHLYRRKLTKKSLKNTNLQTGYKEPPIKEINVEINDNVLNRIRTLLENGR